MKLEQLRAQITAEKVNDKFAQIFGEKVSLNNFTTEQLSSTRDKVIGKLSQIQNALSFDSLNDSEDYQKQRMLLDLLDKAIEERQTNEGGDAWDIAQRDAKEEVMDSADEKEAIDRIKAHMYSSPKDHDESYANDVLNDMIKDINDKGLDTVQHQLAQQDGPMEGNAFADAVQKAKAAGMKKGDKFKVGDKEFTLQDAEDLLANSMNEKAKPDYIDIDKDGNKNEPMKKAAQDKKDKKVKEHGQDNSFDEAGCVGEMKKLFASGCSKNEMLTKVKEKYGCGKDKFMELYASHCKNESVVKEGAEDEAQLVMASKDMVDKITGWMEDTASMMSEGLLELTDAIRDEMGSEQSEAFENQIKPALESLYSTLETTRESLTGGVAIVTGEGAPTQMGAEPEVPAEEPASDDDMPDQADDFSASEPATGGEEPADRGKRESIARLSRSLAEVLSSPKKKA